MELVDEFCDVLNHAREVHNLISGSVNVNGNVENDEVDDGARF